GFISSIAPPQAAREAFYSCPTTAFRFPGGRSLVKSSASAARRAATSRSPFFAWKSSFVMSSAARIAALCVSTIGPCASTFHPASSSATWRRMVSSWSRTCASALSPSYAKLTLQSLETPRQQRIHVPLAQRPLGIAERAVPGHAALPHRDAGPPILVEHLEPL